MNDKRNKQGQDSRIQTFPAKYDSSIPDDILFPEFMMKRITPWGNRGAFVDADTKKEYTYSQLKENSYALAAGFQIEFDLKQGDIVAVVLPNCLEHPIIIFGITLCGATASLINPSHTINELAHSVNLIKPKILIGTSDSLVKFQEIYREQSDRPLFVLLDALDENKNTKAITLKDVAKSEQAFKRPTVIRPREDVALILFSSGTTGVPKGVMLTHSNMMAARRQTEEIRRIDPPPRGTVNQNSNALCMGAILPFFHTFGITVMFDSLLAGAKLILVPNFSLHRFLQAIQDFKINVVTMVPAIAIQLAKQPVEEQYDLRSLKAIGCGAAALSAETIGVLQKKLKCVVNQGYGMTEATVRSHSNFKGFSRTGSIGVVLPFCESKIVDRDTNELLGPNQEGEICVRGETIMKGYIGDAGATSVTIDPEGWLHTGDVGFYDNDGYFFITDRMKELIKYKGLQVSPTELEKILLTHPDVLDVAVAPIADQSAGEVPRAYIVKRPESSVTGEELAIYLSEKVSPYKWLRGGVVFIDAVPKNSAGKIIRRALQAKVVTSKL